MAESTINYASYFSAIDLSQLAPPQIIEQLAYTDIFSAVLQDFVARDPSYTILLESQPAIKVLETGSYREHILRQAFNERAQQLLIAFAVGTNLDHLGAFYACYRKVLIPADTTVIPNVVQVMESDSDYRKRIQLAPEVWSNAGPMGAYLYHTYDASVGVQNCVVYNAASGLVKPGTVLVVVRIRDGFTAAEVTDAVRTRLFRDDIKPMTDNVQIKVAQPFNFAIDATLYVNDGPDKTLIRTQARERVVDWVSGAQRRDKIGNLLPWGGVSAQLYGPYVERLVLRSPAPGVDIVPGLTQYANLSSLNIQVLKNA